MSVIVDALIAGAAVGGKEAATAAIKDAYGQLKELLSARMSTRHSAQTALAQVEAEAAADSGEEAKAYSGSWREVLEAELVETGAASDPDLLTAAQHMISLLYPDGLPAGSTFNVDMAHARGVQVGDRNVQTNNFGA